MNAISIMIADEQKLFRQLLISVLNDYSFHTIGEACNGAELLEQLAVKKPDIVLLDIGLSCSEGFLVAELRKRYPYQKIMMMSNYPEALLSDFFYGHGINSFITKNSDLSVFVETICAIYENSYQRVQPDFSKQPICFSKREADLIPLMIEGRSNKEIADSLQIGNKAVEAHKKNIFRKTKTQSSLAFVIYALKQGLNYLR